MSARRGFTLIEMLTVLAALVIVLSLMVSLAGHVRKRAALALTERVLLSLQHAMNEYIRDEGSAPVVAPLTHNGQEDEAVLQESARRNNRSVVAVLQKSKHRLENAEFTELPPAIFNQEEIRDAWGTPIVYMPPGALNIGISPLNRSFFFSAGPDRQFRTLEDNLYSYDESGG